MIGSAVQVRRSRWAIALWLIGPIVLTAFAGLTGFALIRRERAIETAGGVSDTTQTTISLHAVFLSAVVRRGLSPAPCRSC